MKNTLADLNNRLFDELERLSNGDLDSETLEKELRRADGMTKIATQIIQNGELAFRTMQHMDQSGYGMGEKIAPAMLDYKNE